MIERRLELKNRLGLHARAAAKLVHLASKFESKIQLEREGHGVDGKSILGILLLAAAQGTAVTLRATGSDETAAADAIGALFDDRFGEGE